MPRSASITFRGEEADVEYRYDYDPSVGIDGVSEWWFIGAVPTDWTPTDEEHEAIALRLTEIARHDDMVSGPDDY